MEEVSERIGECVYAWACNGSRSLTAVPVPEVNVDDTTYMPSLTPSTSFIGADLLKRIFSSSNALGAVHDVIAVEDLEEEREVEEWLFVGIEDDKIDEEVVAVSVHAILWRVSVGLTDNTDKSRSARANGSSVVLASTNASRAHGVHLQPLATMCGE